MTFCTICGRASFNEDEYCRYHKAALDNLQSSFESWKRTSDVSWEGYIEKLCQIEETGQWVREVAQQIKSGDGPSIPS